MKQNNKAQTNKPSNQKKTSYKGKQGRKDSNSKRVNYDNERVSKAEKDIEGFTKTNKCNDVSWYALNPDLLRSAASLPFSHTTGTHLGFDGNVNGPADIIPGVFGIEWNPKLGDGALDAINAAKDQLYSYVVHANSRNSSYDATDLMMVVISGMNVFSAIGAAIRAYGTMRMYDQRNAYLPKGLVTAMGFNFEDLKENLAQMWFDINEMIARSSQIWIPNTMPLLNRWFWLNSNIYMDSSSIKGQYYVFTQRQYYGYDETGYNTGTALSWMSNNYNVDGTAAFVMEPSATHTWSEFRQLINGMMDLLLNSQDRGIIMGDILKAFGAEKMYALSSITSDYTVVPVYDQEVLTQIENSTSCGIMNSGYLQNASGRIVENNALSTISNLRQIPTSQAILNFHTKEVPTPEMVMVATRLTSLGLVGSTNDGTSVVYALEVGATEQVIYYTCIRFNIGRDFDVYQQYTRVNEDAIVSGSVPKAEFYSAVRHTAFDWAPWIFSVRYPTLPTTPVVGADYSSKVVYAVGDYDNCTVLNRNELRKMHNTAVYSLLGVPIL